MISHPITHSSRYVTLSVPAAGIDPDLTYELVDPAFPDEAFQAQLDPVGFVTLNGRRKPLSYVAQAHFATPPVALELRESKNDLWQGFEWANEAYGFLSALRAQFEIKAVKQGCVMKRFFIHGQTTVPFSGWLDAFTRSGQIRGTFIFHNGHPGAAQLALQELRLPQVAGYRWVYEIDEPALVAAGSPLYFQQRGIRIVRAHAVINYQPLNADLFWSHGATSSIGWTSAPAFSAFRAPVPHFGPARSAIRTFFRNEAAKARAARASGSPWPSASYAKSKRLGHAHPGYGPEGGATGGQGVGQGMGMDLMSCPEADGVEFYLQEQRFMHDRCPVALVNHDGYPISIEDFAGTYVISADDGGFDAGKDSPFNFSAQPKLPAGLCPEQPEMDAFEPIDFPHLARALRSCVALHWLLDEPASQWLIRQHAELGRMSVFRGRAQSMAMKVSNNPDKGAEWSRIQGWIFRSMAEAATVCGPKVSERMNSSLIFALTVHEMAVMPNGLVNYDEHGKEFGKPPYNKQVCPSNAIQHGLLTGGIYAAARSARADFPSMAKEVARIAMRGNDFLEIGNGNTLWSAASRPLDVTKPVFTTRQVGADGLPIDSSHPDYPDNKTGPAIDNEQTRGLIGLLGLAGLEADDQTAVWEAEERVRRIFGANATQQIQATGLQCTDTDALLLAFCEARKL